MAASSETTGQRRDWRTTLVTLTPTPRLVLVLLVLASLVARIVWLNRTGNALIFDETYYVNAARIIDHLVVPSGGHYAGAAVGIDPNHEHPPLGKLLIAWSMALFGDNGGGWRLPSVLAGMGSIGLVYAITRKLGGDRWMALLAAALFSADNLVLVHSRIATLDMPMLFFLLLTAWLWLEDQPLLAGVAAALAALVKITAIYGLFGLGLMELGLLFWAYRRSAQWLYRPVLRKGILLAVTFLPVWFVGLWVLDYFVGAFHTPWDHLGYMLHYGLNLTRTNGPANAESDPWQWLINEVPINYFRVDQNILVNGKVTQVRPLIWFRGAMNPVIIGTFPLALGYAIWRAWKFGDRIAMWTLGWFAGNYLPFYPLSMAEHRISYIFYFLPAMPAVALAIAQLLRQFAMPVLMLAAYLLFVLIAFYGYFPFRTF